MSEPLLNATALHKAYGPTTALDGAVFAVDAGEIVAVMGPSGSGKSTLLHCLAGIVTPDSGTITYDGRELSAMGDAERSALRRGDFGFVFQFGQLVPELTCLENVALPLELAGKADAFEVARALLGEVGLSHRTEHFPAQLSGGEQQRVAVARALSAGPQILLADEPTGNLDGKTGDYVVDLLFDLQRRRQATLVLVTHETRLATRCGRVVSMADGRVEPERAAA